MLDGGGARPSARKRKGALRISSLEGNRCAISCFQPSNRKNGLGQFFAFQHWIQESSRTIPLCPCPNVGTAPGARADPGARAYRKHQRRGAPAFNRVGQAEQTWCHVAAPVSPCSWTPSHIVMYSSSSSSPPNVFKHCNFFESRLTRSKWNFTLDASRPARLATH